MQTCIRARLLQATPRLSPRTASRRRLSTSAHRRCHRASSSTSNANASTLHDPPLPAPLLDAKPASNDSELRPDYGLILSPGGFLVSYYLGVLECLSEMQLLHDATPVAGTSAGALAAAFMVSGISISDCVEITKDIQAYLVKSGYGWKVIDILKRSLMDVLPDDVHLRATGRVGIGVTVYTRDRQITGRVLTEYTSKDQFVDAVAASCYIPFYLGPRLGIKWSDGSIYSDGMPKHFFPEAPVDATMHRDSTLTISAFPAANRRLFDDRDVDISPDRRHPSEIPGIWKVLWNGLVPLKTKEVEAYRQRGYADTLLWAQQATQQSHLNRDPKPSLSIET